MMQGTLTLQEIYSKAIVLRGSWGWKQYKTYDTNFGWCVYAKDEQAKEDMKRLYDYMSEYKTSNVFIRVRTSAGKEEIIGLPQRVFEDNADLRWFEFSKKTLKTLERDYKRECKYNGNKPNFQVIEL